MLSKQLEQKAQEKFWRTCANIERHHTLLNAFGIWAASLGVLYEDGGAFSLNPTVYDHEILALPRLALQLDTFGSEARAGHIDHLEQRIGQRLTFIDSPYSIGNTSHATILHPEIGEITIVVTGMRPQQLNARHAEKQAA